MSLKQAGEKKKVSLLFHNKNIHTGHQPSGRTELNLLVIAGTFLPRITQWGLVPCFVRSVQDYEKWHNQGLF